MTHDERESHASYNRPKPIKVEIHFASGKARQFALDGYTDERIEEAKALIRKLVKGTEMFDIGDATLNPEYIECARIFVEGMAV